ncbi:unnamed protein product [Closterium sp. NIES-65]|nr:unnamed protein product [Closterium sp. NIES-65]
MLTGFSALTFSHAPIPCSHAPIRITGAARDASMNARLKVGSQVSTSQCSMFSNPTTTGAARDPNPDAQLQVGTRGEDDCQGSQVRPLHHRHAVCPTNFSCAATTDRRGVACVCEGNTQSTDGSCTVDEEYYTAPEPAPSPTDKPTDTPPVNTGVDCSAALTRGQTLNVTERDDLASCSVFYFIQPGDTCESVAASLGLSSSSLPLLNPGSVCSSPLNPSRSLCIERDDGKVGTGEQRCNSLYSVSCTSSCTAVVGDRQLVSLLELYRLNPGLVCYSSVNAGREVSRRRLAAWSIAGLSD